MKKRTLLALLFLSAVSILLIVSCINQQSNLSPDFGMVLNQNTENVGALDSGPFPYEPPDALLNVFVERVVIFKQSLTQVSDYFAVKNIKTNPKDFIQVGLKYELRENLYHVSAIGMSQERLRIVELPYDGSGFSKWNIYLDDPILPQEIYNFTLFMYFGDIVDFDIITGTQDGSPQYNYIFYKYPSSPYYSEYVRGVFPNADDKTPYSKTNLPPWSYETRTGKATFGSAVLECTVYQRQIEIDRWGWLYIREYYQLTNLVDIKTANTWIVQVPADALNIHVYDFLTDLIVAKIPNPFALAINITVSWETNRFPLRKGQFASFFVEYRRPLELHHLESGDLAQFIYQFDPQKLTWKASSALTTFKLPKGSSILSLLPSASSIMTIDGQIYVNYLYQNSTSQDYFIFLFNYLLGDTLFFDFSRPLTIAGLISIPLISLIILKRELPRKKELRLRPTEVPSHVIREFISLYSEKNALYIEIEKLEEDLTRRKIKKREYRNQIKTIERKLADLNKELKKFQDEIMEAGGRYARIIEELELREADRDMSREALEAIERRYRISRRISTTTYRKLKKEEEKALQKAKNDIDKLIQELRELMG